MEELGEEEVEVEEEEDEWLKRKRGTSTCVHCKEHMNNSSVVHDGLCSGVMYVLQLFCFFSKRRHTEPIIQSINEVTFWSFFCCSPPQVNRSEMGLSLTLSFCDGHCV